MFNIEPQNALGWRSSLGSMWIFDVEIQTASDSEEKACCGAKVQAPPWLFSSLFGKGPRGVVYQSSCYPWFLKLLLFEESLPFFLLTILLICTKNPPFALQHPSQPQYWLRSLKARQGSNNQSAKRGWCCMAACGSTRTCLHPLQSLPCSREKLCLKTQGCRHKERAVVRTGLKEQSLSWKVSLALALSKQRLVMQDKKSQYVLCKSVYMCMSLGLHTHIYKQTTEHICNAWTHSSMSMDILFSPSFCPWGIRFPCLQSALFRIWNSWREAKHNHVTEDLFPGKAEEVLGKVSPHGLTRAVKKIGWRR